MKNTFLDEYETKEKLSQFILRAKRLSMGEECFAFEKKFARFQGQQDAVLFNSGGSANLAIFQALKNLGKLKDGDKVGFSAITWATNLMPIIQLGLKPVVIDCTVETLNTMSTDLLKRLEETDLKAMFITNALGFAGDLEKIKEICDDKGILLLEDNCEALGSEVGGKKTGTFGAMSSFSFFVAHHMSTVEGGMVCTDDEELAEMLRIVRANGWDRNIKSSQQHKWRSKFNIDSELQANYTFYDLGYNFRPTEITGFLGQTQLEFLPDNIKVREKNYNYLTGAVKENDELVCFDTSHLSVVSNFSFPVLCNSKDLRKKYIERFSGAGIEIRPMISGNIQRQPFFDKYISETYDLKGADTIHDQSFYCGNYPELTELDLDVILRCLEK